MPIGEELTPVTFEVPTTLDGVEQARAVNIGAAAYALFTAQAARESLELGYAPPDGIVQEPGYFPIMASHPPRLRIEQLNAGNYRVKAYLPTLKYAGRVIMNSLTGTLRMDQGVDFDVEHLSRTVLNKPGRPSRQLPSFARMPAAVLNPTFAALDLLGDSLANVSAHLFWIVDGRR